MIVFQGGAGCGAVEAVNKDYFFTDEVGYIVGARNVVLMLAAAPNTRDVLVVGHAQTHVCLQHTGYAKEDRNRGEEGDPRFLQVMSQAGVNQNHVVQSS